MLVDALGSTPLAHTKCGVVAVFLGVRILPAPSIPLAETSDGKLGEFVNTWLFPTETPAGQYHPHIHFAKLVFINVCGRSPLAQSPLRVIEQTDWRSFGGGQDPSAGKNRRTGPATTVAPPPRLNLFSMASGRESSCFACLPAIIHVLRL